MAGNHSIRIAAFLALASGIVLGQQAVSRKKADPLPDAPSALLNDRGQTLRAALSTARHPMDIGTRQPGLSVPLYNPAEFQFLEAHRQSTASYSLLKPRPSAQRNELGNSRTAVRALDAASSFVIKRDIAGRKHLNTQYLLAVATNAVADVAHTPYWRRSPAQPLSNFGSNIGNDAGMNVLHQFQPGILRMVTAHLPEAVAKRIPASVNR